MPRGRTQNQNDAGVHAGLEEAVRDLVQAFMLVGRANTGKSEVARLIYEFCIEAGIGATLVDMDTEKKELGSLSSLYGEGVVRMSGALDAADVAKFFFPEMIRIGAAGKPAIIDCAGSDLRLTRFGHDYKVAQLSTRYNVEVILVFLVSADPADLTFLEKLERTAPVGVKRILVFNEKHQSRTRTTAEQWTLFKRNKTVLALIEGGAEIISLPRQDDIHLVSHLPVHRGRVGLDGEEGMRLEAEYDVPMWSQTQILDWYRACKAEFATLKMPLPWRV